MPRRIQGKHFKSSEQTGNGSVQNITHTLGRIPSLVLVIPSSVDGASSFVEGTHTSTVIKVTATTGAKYVVIAL